MKEILGPDCVFVVLCLSEETQEKRVEKRHQDMDENLKKWVLNLMKGMAKQYEDAGEDEENAINVRIDPEDTENDVIEKILDAVKPFM